MTSSPGSTKPMKAHNIPSFAPVVMVTSVSGLISFPKNGEYAFAMAFFSRGRPCLSISLYSLASIAIRHRLLWANTDCSQLCPALLSPRLRRISEGCSHWPRSVPSKSWISREGWHTHKNPWPIFIIGWTGDAAAASLTIDLNIGLVRYVSGSWRSTIVPHILPLASNPVRRSKGITSDHLCRKASAEACPV